MKHLHTRRDTLRMGFSGLAMAGIGSLLRAAPTLPATGTDPKMLFIFLRGGNDGLNTLVPVGDPLYSQKRSVLDVSANALSLTGNTFAKLHPAMADAQSLFNGTEGNLALIHRVGVPDPSLSHFTAQQIWETASPIGVPCTGPPGSGPLCEEGFVARLLDVANLPIDFKGVSISGSMQRAFRSEDPDRVLPHIESIDSFVLNDAKVRQFLEDAYDVSPSSARFDALVRSSGQAMFLAQNETASLSSAGTVGNYPDANGFLASFSKRLKDAVKILRDTDCRIAGVELGGFDTHIAQDDPNLPPGQVGDHTALLGGLAQALRAINTDTNLIANPLNLLTLVVSEFGRTTAENVAQGTDHGQASVALAMGPCVKNGVYNCDAVSWPDVITSGSGAMTQISPMNGKYLKYRTDFRALYAEVIERHFDITATADLDTIIPSWSSAGSPSSDPTLQPIDFLL